MVVDVFVGVFGLDIGMNEFDEFILRGGEFGLSEAMSSTLEIVGVTAELVSGSEAIVETLVTVQGYYPVINQAAYTDGEIQGRR